MSKNIVLVGFMGAGKSSVAAGLAKTLKRKVVSTDASIVEREKRPITDIFRDSGEPYFRGIEQKVVAEVSKQSNLIVDCGGGVVLNQENVDNLKRGGTVFYLSATPEVIYERIKHERHRPLVNVDNPKAKIEELLNSRKSRYALADVTIDTSHKTVQQVVEEILKLI